MAMTDFRAVLFDLDGTLLDTLSDLAASMNAVLTRLALPTHPRDAYRYFVGDGIENLAIRALPSDQRAYAMIHRCAEAMRAEYQGRWAESSAPYEGIPELLDALAGRGLSLAILSNKPNDLTRLMVDHYLSAWPWQQVRGARPEMPRKPDPSGALAIAHHLKLPPSQVLYLGDTNTDMRTAAAAGMTPIGALWGFRSKAELEESGAHAVINHPLDLLRLV